MKDGKMKRNATTKISFLKNDICNISHRIKTWEGKVIKLNEVIERLTKQRERLKSKLKIQEDYYKKF